MKITSLRNGASLRTGVLTASALAVGLTGATAALAEWKPNRPVELVVSAGPGGGSDIFTRVVQAALTKNKLVETPLIVVNKPGGSGSEAFNYAEDNVGSPYKVYFGTQDAYVLPLGTKVNYAMKDLTPVASMVFDVFILWSNPKASGINTAQEFVAKAKENPGKVRVAGAKAKDADETVVTLMERAAGIDLAYIPYKSGSEAAIQVAGGHIEANTNNPSESLEQWKAGNQKPLCVFTSARLTDKTVVADGMSWADIPTCVEAGIDVKDFVQPRTVWMAADVPPEAVAYYTELMKKAMETPEFKDYTTRNVQITKFMAGDELKTFLAEQTKNYEKIYADNNWLLPASQ
ncbi:Bug family tripartite tricarboxylate transporter substrate binding protein [Ancylobacter rudongensis]|uniref:Tripartite-type tricarboxylate transporter, receptor component TctC n=1 Tax=Ancylobacter rudongensis TaxID=177413 RepID=A0A1G4SJ72_9HYPH|nr:tripartite tricarboxylate transporter substrate-binding protein [Ancylobacter rudongensis]SCW69138.1 Tripartite-type tricarboxylate transporter, receptor component TctC [Ancylobacter rudongensis]